TAAFNFVLVSASKIACSRSRIVFSAIKLSPRQSCSERLCRSGCHFGCANTRSRWSCPRSHAARSGFARRGHFGWTLLCPRPAFEFRQILLGLGDHFLNQFLIAFVLFELVHFLEHFQEDLHVLDFFPGLTSGSSRAARSASRITAGFHASRSRIEARVRRATGFGLVGHGQCPVTA